MNQHAVETTSHAKQMSGKYLIFRLGEETYGLEIMKVREIVSLVDITTVPRMPAFIRGVINLRGRVIPVMDLSTRFGMPDSARTAANCIIVVYVRDMEMGVIVDNVREVLYVPETDIEETPSFGVNVDTRFIMGIGKTGGTVTLLLNVDQVLSADETSSLNE